MYSYSVYSTALAFTTVVSVALSSATLPPRQANGSPCALITQTVNDAGNVSFVNVPGQLALQCLRSMPFHQDLAADYLSQISRYIQFQSTIEALKSPPEGYLNGPVDILAQLDAIATNISSNAYASQYDFDVAVMSMINSPNDGHFSLGGICSTTIFDFRRSLHLVSISHDGLQLPQVYSAQDAALLANDSSAPVSPIVTVEGQPVDQYLAAAMNSQSLQDPDARYNQAFFGYASSANSGRGYQSEGSFGFLPFGSSVDDVTVAYQNGTSDSVGTFVKITSPFNSTDGESLFQASCIPAPSKSGGANKKADKTSAASKALTTYASPPLGYPEPTVRDPLNEILGYELKGGYSDAVVLVLPTFQNQVDEPKADVYGSVVDEVATKFVDAAVKAGKTRIIIDVTGNPGGEITRGFDLFKLFFPHKFPYSATRFRNHNATTFLGRAAASRDSGVNKTNAFYALGALAYQGDVTPDQEHDFASMTAVFDGGHELGVPVSNLVANFNYSSYSTQGAPIQGYGGTPEAFSSAPFKPENILIIGDGACSSTCTTFTNLMTNVGGARSLALGGRPNGQAMQIMGGVRGAQSGGYALFDHWVDELRTFIQDNPDFFTKEELTQVNKTVPLGLSALPLVTKDGEVNFRNAYQEGTPHLPLQFAYQAANCRLYYTWDNIIHPPTTWTSAYNAVWGNGTCVGPVTSPTPLNTTSPAEPSSSPTTSGTGSPSATASTTSQGNVTGAAVSTVRNGMGWVWSAGTVAGLAVLMCSL